MISRSFGGVVDAEGNHFHKTYDALGRILTEYRALNREKKTYAYASKMVYVLQPITNAIG
jgi:hypothetical protein